MARRRPGSGAAGAKRLLPALRSVRRGDFSGHLAADQTGVAAEIAEAFNDVVELMDSLTKELERISRVVGKEGSIKERASLPGASGAWAAWINALNTLVDDLVRPIEEVAHVIGAVAKGDLSQRIPLETEGTPLKGEFLSIARTVNTMVDQLNSFASEVTRVAHEVGTEGRLGGQAQVKGVAGVWKDLTDNVNSMAANLTGQVRNIADVTTAVAKGNLSQKVTVDVKGEILELKNTINAMVDQLNSFGSEVTRVTCEVGTEGKLESRAVVKGMAGVWKDLTDNVNEMIRNLRETTQKSTEQDWLKTNLAKFTQMLQGRRDLMTVAKLILSELAPVVSAQHGVFYLMEAEDGTLVLKLLSAYAYQERKGPSHRFRLGEGLVGQCALEKERILITDVPEDYIRISSGLGEAPPLNIVVLPVLFEGQVKAVIELASFNRFKDVHLNLLDQLTETIGVVLNTIEANMRTETLLRQSQSLAQELQSQQEELQETNARLQGQAYELQTSEELLKNRQEELKGANEELQSKAQQLAQQKAEVEAKNREIELANLTLEERAEQLAVASRYKSEFLANMSHELRTPLNSLLILAEMLASDQQGTMTPKQIEFASTIYSAGSDLLTLIDDILDMAKIESGTMVVEVGEARFTELRDLVERTFRPVAENKGLHFTIELADNLPKTISTDAKRLQQVLRNLLSNAFKFTEDGKVSLHVDIATKGWSAIHPVLSRAETVIAFAVSDTGVGIPPEKLNVVFEPFQQAEMGAARKYGGSGLGLSISRAITRLLGGEIRVQSTVAEGSTFTLYLPRTYRPLSEPTAALVSRPAERVARIDVVGAPRREVSFPPRPKRSEISDDYAAIASGDRVVLIVERDPKFAAVLLDTAHEQGFKAVIAPTGETGLALALQLLPNAITLDLRLPDLPGWVVLDRLKHDLTTRHIPVQLISSDSNIERGRKLGAFACLRKPVTREALDKAFARIKNFVARRMRTLLVVEDIAVERDSIMHMIGDGEIQVTAVGTAGEALAALQAQPYDCLLLDLRLPDLPGLELLEKVRKELDLLDLPVIVYTGKELSEDEEARLQQLAETVISKAPGALERVRETVGLFLHRVGTNRPTSNEQVAPEAPAPDQLLAHKKILAVDDDVRSLFAIASMLERWQMQVLRAESGREALAILDEMPDIDLVLMDIMMPYLDGYETIRRIRQQERFQYLPIIALTAKALKGDREKCLAAGASDYIAKPVKVEQLQALLHVWLDRPAPGESPLNRF